MQEVANGEKNNPNAQKGDSTESNLDLNRRSLLKLAGATAGATAGGLSSIGLGSKKASAVSVGEAHTIDDFEDGDLSEYDFDQGSSGASLVSSPTYDGSYALEISGTDTEMISMSGLDHYPSAGSVFSYWVRATGGADDTNFAYGVQNHQNKYYVNLDFTNDHIIIFKYENDSSNSLNSTTVTLNEDIWYQIGVQWKKDGTHIATLYDTSGSQLAQVSTTDTTWTAGGVGYSAYTADGSAVYYDRATLDSGRDVREFNYLIDSFEDGGLGEYTFVSGASGANVVSSPLVEGASALELSGASTAMHSTSGLENYPSQGDVFSTWVRATSGANDTNFKYGVQDGDNLYYVNLEFANDAMRFFTYKNGDSNSKSSATVTLKEDAWYRLEIDWRKTGKHTATIYDADGNYLQHISMTDTTWNDGGIGFSAYLSGSETVYYDQITSNYSVADDFEDGDISEYNGDTGSFTVQNTTVLEGNKTLKGISAPSAISHTGIESPRGQEFRATVMVGDSSGGKPGLLSCIQDSNSPLHGCYYLISDPVNNKILLYRQDSGNSVLLDETSVTLSEATEYTLSFTLGDEVIRGSIEDTSGNELAGVAEVDTTYSDGLLGLYAEGGTPVYFDKITRQRVPNNIVDDFEDGDLTEYQGDTAYYNVQSSTVLQGSFSVECTDDYRNIAHGDFETKRGQTYSCELMAGSNSGAKPGILTCVQDPNNPIEDCYWARIEPSADTLSLYRREAGNSYLLDDTSVSLSEGKEYHIAITLHDEEVRASLFGNLGRPIANTAAISDTTYSSGTIGFHSSSGAPVYFDYVKERPISDDNLFEVSEKKSVGNNAVNSTPAQKILDELNNPSTDTSSTTRGNFYPEKGRSDSHLVRVPIEYGDLIVEYKNGSVEGATAQLDRSTMPQSLIDELSDDFGWPSSEDGTLLYINGQAESSPLFVRSTADSEEQEVVSTVNGYESKDGEPYRTVVRNHNGGYYYSIFNDKHYAVDSTRDTVHSDTELYGSPSCETLRHECNIEELWSDYSAAKVAITCAVALLEPTPALELLCIHGGLVNTSIDIGLGIGGRCQEYREKCVDG